VVATDLGDEPGAVRAVEESHAGRSRRSTAIERLWRCGS
jgi:hypothetical protein